MSWLIFVLVIIIFIVVKVIVVLFVVVICGVLLSWVECCLFGFWQDCYGFNWVGLFGVFQFGVDMVKMFFKEDWILLFVDKMIFILVLVIVMGVLFVVFVIVLIIFIWGVVDLNIGILFFFVMVGLMVYVVLFVGWLSNNKFVLFGSLCVLVQIIFYEVFLVLLLMGIVVQVGLFNMCDIVQYQIDNVWFIILQFFGFCIFIIVGVVVIYCYLFDQLEVEQELVDGYYIEYVGMKWGMFFVGEYIGIVLVLVLLVILFFGGWYGLFLDILFWLLFFYFVVKIGFFIMFFILICVLLLCLCYDQVMVFSWKVCLLLILINLLVIGVFVLVVVQ